MNSAPTNLPGPKLSRKQREEKERDEYFASIVSESLQLKRTLWLVLRTLGSPTVTIDQTEMSLLWDLKYSEVPDAPTKVTLTANLIPEATDEQIASLKAVLMGKEPALHAARKDETVGLANHPLGYLQGRLMDGPDGIVWNAADQKWLKRESPKQEPPPTHAV